MDVLNEEWRENKMKLVPYFHRSETPIVRSLFDEVFNSFPLGNSFLESRESWVPSVDVLEKDGNLILRAELPGLTEKQIDLKVEGNMLTLKGERKMEKEDEKSNYHRIESSYGSFTRSFQLPETVDLDKINAEYKNGVLTITLPQKPEVKPREIPVSIH
jgi:HSP20 family protein